MLLHPYSKLEWILSEVIKMLLAYKQYVPFVFPLCMYLYTSYLEPSRANIHYRVRLMWVIALYIGEI